MWIPLLFWDGLEKQTTWTTKAEWILHQVPLRFGWGSQPKPNPHQKSLERWNIGHKELIVWKERINKGQEGKWKCRKEKQRGYRPKSTFLVPESMFFPPDHFLPHKPSARAAAKTSTGKTNDADTHIFPAQCGFAVFTVNVCNRM